MSAPVEQRTAAEDRLDWWQSVALAAQRDLRLRNREYGRASATIGELRGTVARLRAERDRARALLGERASQAGAPDDPADDVHEQHSNGAGELTGIESAVQLLTERLLDRVLQVADQMIVIADLQQQLADRAGTAGPRTSPGGRGSAGDPPTGPAPGDPTLAGLADTIRDQLAATIARYDLNMTGGQWATTNDHLRGDYRRRADDVILAGWRLCRTEVGDASPVTTPPPCGSPIGVHDGRRKVTDAEVLQIRARYVAGGVLQRELAVEYGIGQTQVSVLVRKPWVPGEPRPRR